MKHLLNVYAIILILCVSFPPLPLLGQNQTEILSPVLSEALLPFTVAIDIAPFSLPQGIQSYASAIYKGRWVLLAGRTNGLHGFDNVVNNFPPLFQNTTVYVTDPASGLTISRSLTQDCGLTQLEIDTLSVTASQAFQKNSILYLVGGYGINSVTGQMETKSTLTAINLPKLIKWVKRERNSLRDAIRQVSHPILQVTGGSLFQNTDHDPFLLMLGQNFSGLYRPDSNGVYTRQIRPFWVIEQGEQLFISAKETTKVFPDYRRRDLNIVPIMHRNNPAYAAFAGVFTLDTGVWTVPITIAPDGFSTELNPRLPGTFKQAMNHYNCPVFGLYSTKTEDMYVIFPGGISYGFFSGGVFQTDSEIPFINQVTTVKIDRQNQYTQHLMNHEYPFIVSTGPNPGNQLLFGAEAQFFLADGISTYHNGVIQLDTLTTPVVIGYIVGGIMSTLPNTNTTADSTASPYVFTVTLIPK